MKNKLKWSLPLMVGLVMLLIGSTACEMASQIAPVLEYSPTKLEFTIQQGAPNSDNQSVDIWNYGKGFFHWTVSKDKDWVILDPTSGTAYGDKIATTVTVAVNSSNMTSGNYTANITISAPGALQSPQVVLVYLEIKPQDH